MQKETEIEESAESLVEDVETTLQERKEQAIQNAREAETKEDQDDKRVRFSTPPVVGGEIKSPKFGDEKVEFHLMNSFPNGTDSFTVDMPSESEVTDQTHELNRLLSLHNVNPEQIGDLNGSRLPVIPKGDYNDVDSLSYELDIPPVPTKPNMALYKLRRIAMNMKLIRWGRTPYVRTNMFGDIRKTRFEDDRDAKCMPESAGDLYLHLNWESSTQRFVPTERGMKILFGSFCLLAATPMLVFGFTPIPFLVSLMLFITVLGLFVNAVRTWKESIINKTNETLFPDP